MGSIVVITAVLSVCLFVGCANGMQRGTPSAARATAANGSRPSHAEGRAFWQWFSAHSGALRGITSGSEPIADELAGALHRVHPNLTFELGPNAPTREFIVSADGIRATFPAVQSLVAAAPALDGWKVIAFRQRHLSTTAIRINEIELDPRDVWFRAEPDEFRKELISLTVFVEGATAERNTDLAHAVFLLLDSTLGEYDVETKIGELEIEPRPADPEATGLRHLSELPAVVDTWK